MRSFGEIDSTLEQEFQTLGVMRKFEVTQFGTQCILFHAI